MEFIYECEDVFPVDFCNRVIDKFEKSDLKFKGVTDNDVSFPGWKQSTDLRIYDEPEWVDEEKYFHDMIRKAMEKYKKFLLKMDVDDQVKKQISDHIVMGSYIHPPQIQRTEPGQYYHWHHDQLYPPTGACITYIIYLNDVEKDFGGTTEFSCGKSIQPKAGKIIFFPCTWTYFHRGKTLEKGIKYIATAGLFIEPIRKLCTSRRESEQRKYPFTVSSK
uniref:Fe2OG dioxygenase domain-containing protein n=1 Tax=viral metagenome TaxID=1070528 RepID=A0A6C0J0W2_9ZZZZ